MDIQVNPGQVSDSDMARSSAKPCCIEKKGSIVMCSPAIKLRSLIGQFSIIFATAVKPSLSSKLSLSLNELHLAEPFEFYLKETLAW